MSEKEVERALAENPAALFRSSINADSPVLIVKKSVPGKSIADIIALDAEGRLVLVECKRGWAYRDALAQLLDYASDYQTNAYERLAQDWKSGEGRSTGTELHTESTNSVFPAAKTNNECTCE